MCYLIKASDVCIPTDGELGEKSVLERAQKLARDFHTVMVYQEMPGKGFVPLKVFGERVKSYQGLKTSQQK